MILFNGVVLENFAVFDDDERVDPGVVVFAHETVATEGDAAEETVFADSIQHVLRAVRAVMAARTISRGDGAFVETDESFC